MKEKTHSTSIVNNESTWRHYIMTGRMIVGFATTYAINVYHHLNRDSNPDHGEVYLMQYYVIKLVNGWFSQGTPLSCINKTDGYDITEILLKMVLKTITLILCYDVTVNALFENLMVANAILLEGKMYLEHR